MSDLRVAFKHSVDVPGYLGVRFLLRSCGSLWGNEKGNLECVSASSTIATLYFIYISA